MGQENIYLTIYLYRGICYENIGKVKNSIRCYTQCLWFLDHFLINKYTNLTNLIDNLLNEQDEEELIKILTEDVAKTDETEEAAF